MIEPGFVLPPAGISEAGSWEQPEEIERLRAVAVLTPKLDGATGEQISMVQSDDPTFQSIAAAFRTTFGSGAAVTNFGHKLEAIKKNDESAEEAIRFEVDRILAPCLADRLIRVDKLDITAGPDAGNSAKIFLRFTVLKTGEEQEIRQ